MEQILLAYGLSKEMVAAIMMVYKKHESKSLLYRWRHRLLWLVVQGDTQASMRQNTLWDLGIHVKKVKLVTVVDRDPNIPFSIATTPRRREGRYSFPYSRCENQKER